MIRCSRLWSLMVGMVASALVTCQRPPDGRIEGRVLDSKSGLLPIAGAKVSITGGPSTTTDEQGRFFLDAVPPSDRVLLAVSKDLDLERYQTYSSTQLPVQVLPGATARVAPRLVSGCLTRTTVAADRPTRVSSTAVCGAAQGHVALQIPPAGLLQESGAVFTGVALIELFPVNMSSQPPQALPGDMLALRDDGSSVMLKSLAAAEVRLRDGQTGAPLQLNPNAPSQLQLEVSAGAAPGSSIPAWYYDNRRGLWVEEGSGTLRADGKRIVFEASVRHLSWWNADVPGIKSCIYVQPEPGADEVQVSAQFAGLYQGATYGSRGSDGRYCVNVVTDERLRLQAYAAPAGFVNLAQSGEFKDPRVAGDAFGDGILDPLTEPGSCADGCPLTVAMRTRATLSTFCARGTLKGADLPDQGEMQVLILRDGVERWEPVGLTSINKDGSFCADLPIGQKGYRILPGSGRHLQADLPTLVGHAGGGTCDRAQTTAVGDCEELGSIQVVKRDCTSDGWCQEDVPAGAGNFTAGWATSPNDAWVVSNSGDVIHWDGARWMHVLRQETKIFTGVWASGTTDVWVTTYDRFNDLGTGRRLLHWDGSAWSDQQSPVGMIAAISGSSATNVWVVGRGGASRWDGAGWVNAAAVKDINLDSVWAYGQDEAWVSGFCFQEQPSWYLKHLNGPAWDVPVGSSQQFGLGVVWGTAPNNILVFPCRSSGIASDGPWRWNGQRWEPFGYSGVRPNALFGLAANDLWIIPPVTPRSASWVDHFGVDGLKSYKFQENTQLETVFGAWPSAVWVAGGSTLRRLRP